MSKLVILFLKSKMLFLFFLSLFILRERERVSRGGAEREGERIPGRLRALSAEPDPGLELTKP